MLRKRLFVLVAALAVVSFSAISALAQTGQMRGHVLFKQADGTTVPAAGATIDVYRTDVGGAYHTKTNKRGEWIFAGLPFVGTFTIAASMPNARPDFLPGARAGRDVDFEIVLTPGDGRVLTEAEIKAGTAKTPTGGGGGESAADKAKREEMLKKNEAIAAANKKNEEANAIINRTFKAGNDAIAAARTAKEGKKIAESNNFYTDAIKLYDEGLAADPDQIALLTNKSTALLERGVNNYNQAATSKDPEAAKAGMESSKNDFRAAVEAGTKSVEMAKKQVPATDVEEAARQTSRTYFALSARAEAMRLFVPKVDPTQVDAGVAAYQELMNAEKDPVKKKKQQLTAAKMVFDTGAADKAAIEYKKILETEPGNVDALYYMGLTDINLGYAANDRALLQSGVDYLQSFVNAAPDTHEFKEDAKSVIAQMKSTEKVEPVKNPTRRPGRRP